MLTTPSVGDQPSPDATTCQPGDAATGLNDRVGPSAAWETAEDRTSQDPHTDAASMSAATGEATRRCDRGHDAAVARDQTAIQPDPPHLATRGERVNTWLSA